MSAPSIDEISWPDVPFELRSSLLLAGQRGSEAHGTYVPPTNPDAIDDRDIMGVCVAPLNYYLGLKEWENAEAIKGVWDVVLYDVRKFVRLLCKQNPNVLGLLWLREEDYVFVSDVGRRLIENRNRFIARRPFFESFVGYARGQLKRMVNFEPTGKGYMGAKRKELVQRFGYDCKNAAHLIRLLNMGAEFLETGVLNVRRTHDVQLIRDIKKGKYLLTEVEIMSREGFARCQAALDESKIQEEIDMAWAGDFTTQLIQDFQAAKAKGE